MFIHAPYHIIIMSSVNAEAVNNLKDLIFNYLNTVMRRTLRNGLVMSKWVQE